MNREITNEEIKNVDYQVKAKELAKEIIFLRQYGTKESAYEMSNDNFYYKES